MCLLKATARLWFSGMSLTIGARWRNFCLPNLHSVSERRCEACDKCYPNLSWNIVDATAILGNSRVGDRNISNGLCVRKNQSLVLTRYYSSSSWIHLRFRSFGDFHDSQFAAFRPR